MIGIFDSGAGGLTVLREVRRRLPSADIIYFGDTKYAPYGSKTREEITLRTIEAIGELARHKATSILSACNSVSASLAVSLSMPLRFRMTGLSRWWGPTVAALRGERGRILLAATKATITSGIYQNAFHMLGKEVATMSIPELAGAIEAGASVEDQERIIREAFSTVSADSYDTLVLACTHYPLALALFEKILPGKDIFDPADAVAARVAENWWPREAGNGKLSFLLSKDSPAFRALAAQMFPEAAKRIEVLQ